MHVIYVIRKLFLQREWQRLQQPGSLAYRQIDGRHNGVFCREQQDDAVVRSDFGQQPGQGSLLGAAERPGRLPEQRCSKRVRAWLGQADEQGTSHRSIVIAVR